MATAAPKRTRNAAATREAILESARKAFAKSGYDGAGVREIAAGAGVTAMLVNRYFGSKAGLFAEVVADTMADPVILSAENIADADRARRYAEALVGVTGKASPPLDGFLIMARSASSEEAAKIARREIGRRHQKTAAQSLDGDDAAARAALFLALVAGVQVMRQMIRLPALARADPETLVDILTPAIRALLKG